MNNRITVLVLFLLAFVSAAASQTVYTPERGSAERKAIVDALRVPVERELKQKIVFTADTFNVQGNWAFLSGTPQTPDGGRPRYAGTVYADAVEAGAFDNNYFALMRKTSGRWRVVKYAIGCTDVCYLDWWRTFRAPKAIFPHTE
jgi:hypothetical protein